jgi:hypothetical protein
VERTGLFKLLGISGHKPKANNRRRICKPVDFRQIVRACGHLKFNPKPGQGIPQGSPISALLSNIYMLEFDTELHAAATAMGGLYRRYCDDIMLVVPPEHQSAMDGIVQEACLRAKVRLNLDKTDIVTFQHGRGQAAASAIQYLGFTFSGSQTLLRLGSLSRYYGKMRAAVSLSKQTQRKHNRKEAQAGKPLSRMKTRKLYIQYSYLINRRARLPDKDRKNQGNFLTYAYRAADKLAAPEIKHQVRNHWKKIQEELRKPIRRQLRKP